MTWHEADAKLREICERVLTRKQLDCVKLLNAGYGLRRIGLALGIDKSTVKSHLDAAERKIRDALSKGES